MNEPVSLPKWFLRLQLFAKVFVIPSCGMMLYLLYSDKAIEVFTKNHSYDALLMIATIIFWPSLIVSGLSLTEVFKANKNVHE